MESPFMSQGPKATFLRTNCTKISGNSRNLKEFQCLSTSLPT